jgi:hypothetical protein
MVTRQVFRSQATTGQPDKANSILASHFINIFKRSLAVGHLKKEYKVTNLLKNLDAAFMSSHVDQFLTCWWCYNFLSDKPHCY